MKNLSDTPSSKEQSQVESGRQDTDAVPVSDATLIELGKVSDTKGGFYGTKVDPGFGVMVY
jgi:hypothetical protein